MAWWDHEELKSPEDRSDRYKAAFPEEYRNMQTNVRQPWKMHQDDSLTTPRRITIEPKATYFLTATDDDGCGCDPVINEECDSIEVVLQRCQEIEDDFKDYSGAPTFYVVKGVEVKIKKAGYVVER